MALLFKNMNFAISGNFSSKQKISQINFLAGLLMAFWLPFDRTFFPISIWIWIGTWLLEGDFKKKFQHVAAHKHIIYVLVIIGVFYLLHGVGLLYTENIARGLFDLQLKVIMILFPVVMLSLNSYYQRFPFALPIVFLSGVFLFALISLYQYYTTDMTMSDLPKIHHTYISMYVNFAVFQAIYFFERNMFLKKWKWLWIFFVGFGGWMIWLLQSRSGIGIYLLILTGWYFYKVLYIKSLRYISLVLVLVIGGTIVGLMRTNSLQMESFKSGMAKYEGLEATLGVRRTIWESSLTIFTTDDWLWGKGTGDAGNYLSSVYADKGYDYCLAKNYNAHNQFLETFLKLGVAGLGSLLLLLLVPLIYGIKQKNYLLVFLILSSAIYWLIESMLCRIGGVAFFVLFYNYLYFSFGRLESVKRKHE